MAKKEMHESNNKYHGYHGTVKLNFGLGNRDAAHAFHGAVEHVSKETGHSTENTKMFLDSRMGRHLADAIVPRPTYDDGFHDHANVHSALKEYMKAPDNKKWVGKEIHAVAAEHNADGDPEVKKSQLEPGMSYDDLKKSDESKKHPKPSKEGK